MSIQLEQMVQRPTWKQVLLELIITEKIDPWNIDIIKISEGFLKKIKEMKTMELFIPANMILASAILLRYKSQVIDLQEPTTDMDIPEESEVIEKPQINELKILARIPPKKQVTLNELMDEIDKVIKYEEKRGKIEKKKVEAIVNLKIEGIDIEKQMKEVYDLILKQMNGGNHVLFSKLMSKKPEKKEIIYTLLSILHLTQENRVRIKQNKFFGDIAIAPMEEK